MAALMYYQILIVPYSTTIASVTSATKWLTEYQFTKKKKKFRGQMILLKVMRIIL